MENDTQDKPKSEYIKTYFKNRYNSDPEFREKHKQNVLKSRAKKKEMYREKTKEWQQKNKEHLNKYKTEYRREQRKRELAERNEKENEEDINVTEKNKKVYKEEELGIGMKCQNCGSQRVYHRLKTNDFRCVSCGGVFNGHDIDSDGTSNMSKVSQEVQQST